MIQISNSGSLEIQPAPFVADSVWITNVMITAPSPSMPIRATMTVVPYCSASGSICTAQAKHVVINDVYATASFNQNVAMAMQGIFGTVQGMVTNGSLSW